MSAAFAPEDDVPIRYMDRTRAYYQALGFSPYRWAHFTDAPFAPRTVRNAIIGLIAGLMLGFAIGALHDRLDRKLHSTEDVE